MLRNIAYISNFIFLMTSCYKYKHHSITNGIWFIDAVEINGGSTNFMGAFLDDYKEDTSFYKVMMLENGLVRGEYYTDDTTLHYYVTGHWELIDHNHIQLEADEYINGTFLTEIVNPKKMVLSTDSNQVQFQGIGNVKMVVRISRNEPGSQDDTRSN